MPWKSNPVMIFYNKKLLAKAGVDPTHPPLATYSQFLDTARKIVSSGAAPAAIYPAPTSEFYQSWYDYYPLFIAQTGGKQLVQDGKPQFDSPAGQQVMDFWKTIYSEKLAPNEKYNGDAFADGKAAMAIVGPWAVAVYDKVDWGVAPVPTENGMPADDVKTFSDEKSIGMYSACKNRGTAWDVLKFATSQQQDGQLLDVTGQMPMRQGLTSTYASYFTDHKDYKTFAEQANRIVEVPNLPQSVTIWQTFRDAYSKSVIFGKEAPQLALSQAAGKVQGLVQADS
jgi:multiple sugar transport system substrate-binding protein